MKQLLSFLFILCTALSLTSAPNTPMPYSAELAPEEAFNCNLPAPTGLAVTGTTSNSIAVQWNAVPGAMAYRVQAYELSNGVLHFQNTTNALTQNCVPLPAGTNMEIRVTAICNGSIISINQARVQASTDIIIDLVINGYHACPVDWNTHQAGNPNIDCEIESDQEYIGEITDPQGNVTHSFNFYIFTADQQKACKLESDANALPISYATGTSQIKFNLPSTGSQAAYLKFTSAQLTSTFVTAKVTELLTGYTFKWGKCLPKNENRESTAEELGSSPSVQVSPNPFSDFLQYQIASNSTDQTFQMHLFSATGTVVKQWTCGGSEPTNDQIPTSDLPAGIYLLRIQTNEQTETKILFKHD